MAEIADRNINLRSELRIESEARLKASHTKNSIENFRYWKISIRKPRQTLGSVTGEKKQNYKGWPGGVAVGVWVDREGYGLIGKV